MFDLFLVAGATAPARAVLSRSHGIPRADHRRVVSRIVYVIGQGLQWKDAPRGYGPHKTLNNRFVRWSRLGVFDRTFIASAAKASSAITGPLGCCSPDPEGGPLVWNGMFHVKHSPTRQVREPGLPTKAPVLAIRSLS